MIKAAVGLLLDIDVGHTCILLVSLLQTIEVETGIVANISLDDLRAKEVTVIG